MAADEFFIYKFSREQAGLSGLAFDEGQFGVFGYVTGVRVATCTAMMWPVFCLPSDAQGPGCGKNVESVESWILICATELLLAPFSPKALEKQNAKLHILHDSFYRYTVVRSSVLQFHFFW